VEESGRKRPKGIGRWIGAKSIGVYRTSLLPHKRFGADDPAELQGADKRAAAKKASRGDALAFAQEARPPSAAVKNNDA